MRGHNLTHPESDLNLNRTHIRLKNRDRFLERGIDIPGHVWQERPFNFNPVDFAVGGDRLKEKIYPGEIQLQSLKRFTDDPCKSSIYGCSSAPSDQRAKYFAAFLVQTFLSLAPPNVSVRWESLTSSFDNPALNSEPSLLVMSGLTPNSTPVKLEKARDLLEKHCSIPRIVVIAGEDPITFFSTRLYSSVNNIFFHSSALVKRVVEVV